MGRAGCLRQAGSGQNPPMSTTPSRRTLRLSDRDTPPDPRTGPADPDQTLTVSIYLRPGGTVPEGQRLSREELATARGAAPADVDLVVGFAADAGLEVVENDPARRLVRLSGRVRDLSAAFGTELHVHQSGGGDSYLGRHGTLSVPEELGDVVTGVFGLDGRPQADSSFRVASTQAVSYPITEVGAAYQMPSGNGAGQCVGIIELGGGYSTTDLQTYFTGLSLSTPTVTAVPVDGGSNAPTGSSDGPDGEVMLDIEMVGTIANGATIAVYFAPNTDQGFLDAVTAAIHDTTNKPSVVSISWGGAESTWTAQAMNEMEAAFTDAATAGVSITVAAGDNGSTDGVTDGAQHVDFPASAPHALGCGGTSLTLSGTPQVPTIESEVVWNDLASNGGGTGGGVSVQFAVPSYQANAGVPVSANPGGQAGRGVPDVAGDADPENGYQVRVDGSDLVIGGTSAVAPLWAGLIALCNASIGTDVGWIQPTIYALTGGGGAFGDITEGNNGAYAAGPGWDACTGLGTPRGVALLTALKAAAG
jgi:kumamolisin